MIAELIFTSAPETLDGPGYGVVARSAQLPERLENHLRQLNRYDFALTAGNGDRANPPTVYSHTIFRDGPAHWHVMSRVGFGGHDYTQRAVFFAHHVALADEELPAVSLADWMRAQGMFKSRWDGRVGIAPDRALPAPSTSSSGSAWATAAGDRGWAKVWLDRWASNDRLPAFLILPQEADVLALFAEAQAQLPSSLGREISFITLMNADRTGVDFNWVGLPAGSELARMILQRCPERTIDLSKPLGIAPKTSAPPPRVRSGPKPGSPPKTRRSGDAEHGDDAYDVMWNDRSRRNSEQRPERAGSPAAAPPPPPPPRSSLSEMAKPLTIAASLLTLAAVGGFVASRPNSPSRLSPHSTDSAAPASQPHGENTAEPAPKPPVGELPEGASPAVQVADRTRREGTAPNTAGNNGANAPQRHAPPRADGTTAGRTAPNRPGGSGEHPRQDPAPTATVVTTDSPPVAEDQNGPRTLRLNRWLDEELHAIAPGSWRKLTDTKFTPGSTMSLLTAKGLRPLEVETLKTDLADGGIEIWLSKGAQPSIALRLHDQNLEIRRPMKDNGELLTRLLLSALQISPPFGREVPPSQRLLFLFSPVLPAVSLLDRMENTRRDPPTLPPCASALCQAIYSDQKSINARMRIDRISLSLLQQPNSGWTFNPKAEFLVGPPWKDKVPIIPGDGGWQPTLAVQTFFNRVAYRQSRPPIEAELVEIKPVAISPPPNKDPGATPALIDNGDKGILARGGLTALAGAPALSDSDLLRELFRRFGRVHCSVVISVGPEDSPQEVDILRFGDVPPSSQP